MTKIIIVTLIVLSSFTLSYGGSLDIVPERIDGNVYGHDLSAEGDNWWHYEHGLQMIDAGHWDQAEREFGYYLSHPDMHRRMWGIAYFGLAIMHQKIAGNPKYGAFLKREHVGTAPYHKSPYVNGSMEIAKEYYMMAIKEDLDPDAKIADKAYFSLGTIYFKQKDYPEAVHAYSKAMEMNPGSGLVHYWLGMSYLRTGEIDKAEKEAAEARKLGVSFTALSEGIAATRNPKQNDKSKSRNTKSETNSNE